ncbi:DUF2231 domain-containing protein [Kaarinaea lacus]
MIEIIPNWHPVFVHFAIGLLSISALFHLIAAINSKSTNYYQFESVANWNLWIGTILALVTVGAGWLAYNSVDHDTPSHLAMTDHRNWAMVTTGLFIVIAIWSFQRARKSIPIGWALTIPLLIATVLLTATGWKGGELVYRHGLGVMSLPSQSEHDHGAHDHGDGASGAGHGHDSIDMSGESGAMENDASHEVGEVDHGHDHAHDSIDTADKPVDKKAATDDGHNHEHGDHTH